MEGVKREFTGVPRYKSNYTLMDESHKHGVEEARHKGIFYRTSFTKAEKQAKLLLIGVEE